MSSIDFTDALHPIQGTTNATRQYGLQLLADFSLINTKTTRSRPRSLPRVKATTPRSCPPWRHCPAQPRQGDPRDLAKPRARRVPATGQPAGLHRRAPSRGVRPPQPMGYPAGGGQLMCQCRSSLNRCSSSDGWGGPGCTTWLTLLRVTQPHRPGGACPGSLCAGLFRRRSAASLPVAGPQRQPVAPNWCSNYSRAVRWRHGAGAVGRRAGPRHPCSASYRVVVVAGWAGAGMGPLC